MPVIVGFYHEIYSQREEVTYGYVLGRGHQAGGQAVLHLPHTGLCFK